MRLAAGEDLGRAIEAADKTGAVDIRAEALAWLGETRRLSGDFDGALEALDHSLELRPDSAFALACRGRVHAARDEGTAAITDLRAAVELEPGLSWAYLDLAEQRRLAGDLDGALADLAEAATAGDDSAFLHGTRGQIAMARGDTEPAIASLQAAFERERAPWIVLELADLLYTSGETAEDFEGVLGRGECRSRRIAGRRRPVAHTR